MLVIGLTGSIGMGKSTVAEQFRFRGIPVCDADEEVHKLYAGAAVPLIEEKFPGVTTNGRVDRQKLSQYLLADPNRFKDLENIIHPMVRQVERDFLHSNANSGSSMVVLEIPLLFESGGNELVDKTIVVSTDENTQRKRVMERSGMSETKLKEILSRQMSDSEKKALADYVVDTSGPIEDTKAIVDKLIEKLRSLRGEAFLRHWT